MSKAVAKSIFRNHPFFRTGGLYGWDWATFGVCYPESARILWRALYGSRPYRTRG